MNMISKKETRESALEILRNEAMDAKDLSLVTELNAIEEEYDQKLLEERTKGLVIGFGSAVICVIMGGVVTKIIVSKKDEHNF